jgi:lipopolysaccharide biosynthesis regulator YciM
MSSKTFENEFLKGLDQLTKEQQDKVISYIKALLKRTKSNPNSGLLQFAGSLNPKDVEEISSAIEAGCENIDKNEW